MTREGESHRSIYQYPHPLSAIHRVCYTLPTKAAQMKKRRRRGAILYYTIYLELESLQHVKCEKCNEENAKVRKLDLIFLLLFFFVFFSLVKWQMEPLCIIKKLFELNLPLRSFMREQK